ncbi:hypothetical protein M0804_013227 [Polistes exclamans]|nr:hypothetical protein M0804_013227 [Polistes exclamans]
MLDVSKIHEDEKTTLLLSMLEPIVLAKIHEKVFPLTPYHLSYDENISILETMYSNLETAAIANYRYKYRDQLPLESIQHYVFALLKLYNKCDLRTKENIQIKDRFFDGISDEETKDVLEINNYENMSFPMVVTLAKQIENIKNIQLGDSFSD